MRDEAEVKHREATTEGGYASVTNETIMIVISVYEGDLTICMASNM